MAEKFGQFKSREDLEKLMTKAQMRPELRENYKGYTIFIGDGFSEKPWVHYMKFGVSKEDFDNGAFCTMWLIGEGENIRFGSGLLFDRDHDMWLTEEGKKDARVRTAIQNAVQHVDMLEKAKKEQAGRVLHA